MEKQCNQKSVQVVVSLLDNASNYLVVGCIIQRRSPKFHFFDIRAGYYDIFSFQWHDLSKFALSTCNSDHHHYIPLYTLWVGWNFLVKKCNLLVKPHCNRYSLKIYRDTPDFFSKLLIFLALRYNCTIAHTRTNVTLSCTCLEFLETTVIPSSFRAVFQRITKWVSGKATAKKINYHGSIKDYSNTSAKLCGVYLPRGSGFRILNYVGI